MNSFRKYGSLSSPLDLRDFKVSLSNNIELPTSFTLSNTTIKDQGYVNSCVAHALSSLLEQKYKNIYSTGWIYGYRPEGYYQGDGMYPREALNTLLKKGAVKNDIFNVNVEMEEAKIKVNNKLDLLEAEAEDTKIKAYARLNSINEIKSWLYTKQTPVPVSIATDNLIINKDNIIEIPKTYPNSGHMMLIIGYNELGFIVQNSWGKDWGNNGTAILPYEYQIKEAWAVTTSDYITTEDIKKPNLSIIRNLIMIIIKLLKKLIKI